nr:PREDICTED: Fanconi anemia group D2 protein homolog isoform X2 [Musa acuminata subsp. malaccensis]
MVFLQRTAPNPRKRPVPLSDPQPRSAPAAAATGTEDHAEASGGRGREDDGDGGGGSDEVHVATMVALLADAGCTLSVLHGGPPSLPADPHRFRRRLEGRLSADPSLRSRFLAGFSAYIRTTENLKRVLIPASHDGVAEKGESLARILLLVAPIQPRIQELLLEKLPEYFHGSGNGGLPLKDDVARLIVNQFRWLDFLVDAEGFIEKLMEVLSISPPQLKKEIVGSLPEMIGDQSNDTVVACLDRLLQEDSDVIVPVLDSFSNLNLDEHLQEQAVNTALSCIRTVEAEHVPHLLRFLLLSATPANVRRIISQIREQLKFVGAINSHAARNKKLKGKSPIDSTEASILDALRLSLLFKNILSEAVLNELKSIDKPCEHKVIDVWFLMLVHKNGGFLQKSVERILKKKILEGCFREVLFDQCIQGHRELVKDYFPSFLSVGAYLLSCKDQRANMFGIHLYASLFEEFNDTYSRQEVLGALVTHIGSGVGHEVSSALETMMLFTSKYPQELIPISSHIIGILDYLDGFHEHNLHKVYEVFCQLALSACSSANSAGSSITNELLIIVRKQVSNPDMRYRKMGIIGTLKIVSTLGGANATTTFTSKQKSNVEEALELLKMSIDSCKLVTLPLILLYDELAILLERNTLQPAITEWICRHVGEFELLFLSDLEGGQFPVKYMSNGIEGELWMNLDGDVSPVCLNILPLVSSSLEQFEQCSSSLQFLPSQFSLLSAIERATNQGSLGGIDALLGCPLHLPSSKYLVGAYGRKLTEKQKRILCSSIYYAINWIRELLNAFSTQITGRFDSITQATRQGAVAKIMKRLRNLVLLEGLLNSYLKFYPLFLPELHYAAGHSGSSLNKYDNSILRGKCGASSTSHNKKHKQKKDSMVTEKADANGKLRQPTIMDVLKRAGAVVSQGVSIGSSSDSTSCEHEAVGSNELGLVDISEKPILLESQRCKFRPLLVDCLFILSFSESRDSCCSDPSAELPLHLYLLRDFHNKLDYLNPPSNHIISHSSVNALAGYCRMTASELLNRVRQLFTSLKKHLDSAISFIKDGVQPLPTPGSISYLYSGAYLYFEGIIDVACSFSFTLASEVLATLESVVSSIAVVIDKSLEGNGKTTDVGCCQGILTVLSRRLALSAQKLLVHDPGREDTEKGQKNKGDMIQKILQIYLKYSESTSDLLDELACTVLPQVPSCRSMNTQEAIHGFPTLSPTMFLTWYRVLHEENLVILNKTVKDVMGKSRKDMQGEAAEKVLIRLRQTVNVVVSLVNLCKVHDKVAVHAMAVKYGGKYVDRFLKVFDFLEDQFQVHNDIIIQTVKELQKATRTIQTLCSEAKGLKRTMVTSKVPATKRSMERFLFHVKALLHSTPSDCTFWMGNLKHKDLYGQVVSSQVYHNGEDEMGQRGQNQMEDEDEENNVNGTEGPREVEHVDGQGDSEN